MNMEIIKRNPIIIGFCIIFSLHITGDVLSSVSLTLPAFLLAGIVVGFMVNDYHKIGAINGAVLGLISSLVLNTIVISMMYIEGYGSYFTFVLPFYVMNIVIEIVISAFGGYLGSLIQAETLEDVEERDSP